VKILFLISEAGPFAKAGGLGDVGGSLPRAINKNRGEVRVMMPLYGTIPSELRQRMRHLANFQVSLSWRRQPCGLWTVEHRGVHYYFIASEYYFGRGGIYGYEDDVERFAFFCRAALDSLIYLEDFRPELLHCHDWHTALVPVMLRKFYRHDPYYYGMKTLLTIHNLKHQGILPWSALGDLLGLGERTQAASWLEHYGVINCLKGGLVAADGITTVSPSYAEEIQNSFYGEGLDHIVRDRRARLWGILNGIDEEQYNPATDPYLFANYTNLEGKAANKLALQRKLKLPEDESIPVLALVSRLVPQKGLDLIAHILGELLQEHVQLVVLGMGEKRYEEMFRYFAGHYPDRVAVRITFDEALARQIYGGADMLLMPSLFEPCGLAQMIAMRYGTVPIVRETGGLKDTVIPYNQYTGEGTGFSFANYNAHELLFTAQKAVRIYREEKDTWQRLRAQAFQQDFSWGNSAGQYVQLYTQLIQEAV
jgi:starch synthase